jgi:hypothetical protein
MTARTDAAAARMMSFTSGPSVVSLMAEGEETLRDRIARAIFTHGLPDKTGTPPDDTYAMADAVLDVLGDHELLDQIAARRHDDAFMERLRERVNEDAPILDRLEHQCRYPAPNDAGFPVNQCLDCGGWIIAPPDLGADRG